MVDQDAKAVAKEKKFFDALRDVFVGAKIEGESGFINLMAIKSRYYEKGVFPKLKEEIDEALEPFPGFRAELFDKLYTFFHRYFSESGSIYFRHTAFQQNVYEKVYTDDKDVMLFWKTHMLYYVKTDRLFNSLGIEVDGQKFFFDVSTLQHKKANEKRTLVYDFKERRGDGTLVFTVTYSERGRKTKIAEILRVLKRKSVTINEATLQRAFRVFEKQSEVDYFINKDAKAFLEEQFSLWVYQYMFSGISEWTETRIKQLQVLKDIAFKIIAFISQFEDELVKIWNKPKFVLNSNYVITLDRIAEKSIPLVEKVLSHKNIKAQINEWQDLGIVEETFDVSVVLDKSSKGKRLAEQYKYLPIDSKHFKDLELDILELFDVLDQALDGWLVRSENYQVLNTLLDKFKGKVQSIYIDPPYNVGPSLIDYVNNYKHSTWLTLMQNRLELAKSFLSQLGFMCVTIDHVELSFLRNLVDALFGEDNVLGLVCIKNNPSGRSTVKGFSVANEYAIFIGASTEAAVGDIPRTGKQLAQYDQFDEKGRFQWRNFLRSGGANDTRKARPGLFYPLFITKYDARIPEMKWDKKRQSWVLLEEPEQDEEVVYPISDGIEYTWRLGVQSLIDRFDDLRVRASKVDPENIILEIKFRVGDEGVLPKTIWDDKLYNATAYGTTLLRNIMGKPQSFSFPKSVYAVEQCLRVCKTEENSIAMDFFAGSGTTAHAVIEMNRKDNGKRKYILVELAEYFDTVLLSRVKKIIFSDKWKRGKPTKTGKGSGHFLKYYSLEQYEDTLRHIHYEDADLFDDSNQDPYNQYIFLRDLKMLNALEVDLKQDKVKVVLSKLYDNIDVAETLSNLTGKWIKRITAKSVVFEDGEEIDIENLDWKLMKPLIWW